MTDTLNLKAPVIVPNGTYRLRSAARDNPSLYLEWESGTQITLVQSDKGSKKQHWKIEGEADIFRIINVSSQTQLCIGEVFTGTDGVKANRLGAGNSQQWTIEPRGDQWVIGILENATCIDVANNNVNHVNQHWFLETIESDGTSAVLPDGVYQITNVSTQGDLNMDGGLASAPRSIVQIWHNEPGNGDRQFDVLSAPQGGVEILFTRHPDNSLRWLQDGPAIAPERNICRLIPVQGSAQYYHIALGLKADGNCVTDPNPPGSNNKLAGTAKFNTNDKTQQWYFTRHNPFN